MAVVLLPPGNKFKILTAFEIVQLADIVKFSNDFKASVKNLEEKWAASGDNVYDIDLIGIAATPLSQSATDRRGQELAKEILRKREEESIAIAKVREQRRKTICKLKQKAKQKICEGDVRETIEGKEGEDSNKMKQKGKKQRDTKRDASEEKEGDILTQKVKKRKTIGVDVDRAAAGEMEGQAATTGENGATELLEILQCGQGESEWNKLLAEMEW